MVSLNELCTLGDPFNTSSASLHQACSQPRTAVDMQPLPDPHMEVGFDSAWEALLSGNDAVKNWGR
ncbi:MAG: hypothetical protein Q8J67_03340 [Rhodocyclaceae bacterium]|jgi:hypothetical protein|nr:hypothetical protein [Rhodocyclaceae bacterium]MDP3036630.1 hypothetical protein [Rhodocyclaceae bacterium]